MKIKLLASLVAAALMSTSIVNAEVKVSTKGGLKVKSGDYKFQLGGRLMYDYNKTEKNGVTDENDFDIRRARMYVKGNVSKNWAFKSQFNLHESGIEDFYIRYTGWGKQAQVTIGNQKVPFGLEYMTSSKDISILERSGVTERFEVGRAEGVTLNGDLAGNQTYAIAVFAIEADKDEDIGFASRYTYAPVKTDTSVLHLGLAYQDVDDEKAVGFEAAAATGPFHIQAEYFDGEEGEQDVSGYYVQAGYILTGESRPYKGGKFKRVKPKGKAGAWEVVARYEDGDGKHSDIELGRSDSSELALGLNWYAHENVRFGINYTEGEDNVTGDEGSEFRVRFQLTF